MISKKEYLEMTNEISYLKSRIILLEYNRKEERKEFLDDLALLWLENNEGGHSTNTFAIEIEKYQEKWEARRK